MHSVQPAPLYFKIFAIGMLLMFWYPVMFPHVRVSWKGGNRAPLSTRSRIVSAAGMTAWCLAVFGVYPLVCAVIFALSVCIGFIQSKYDCAAYDDVREVTVPQRKITPEQWWLVLCVADAFFLVLSWYAVVRDYFSPPYTEEQRIVHFMGVGYAVASALGAFVLYWKRPKKQI